MPTFPDCIDCGEPESGSCPDGRCRECDIEYVIACGCCRECLRFVMRPEFVDRPVHEQHNAGCSLAHVEDYTARDKAELADVRRRRGDL